MISRSKSARNRICLSHSTRETDSTAVARKRQRAPARKRIRKRRLEPTPSDAAAEFARRLKRRFGTLDRATAMNVVKVFKGALIPRARSGRRAATLTTRAVEYYQEGVQQFERNPGPSMKRFERELWEWIYTELMPKVLKLPKGEKMLQTASLRRKVMAYLARRKEPTLTFVARRFRRARRFTRP